MTEKMVRCPTVSVMMPSDHARVAASTASMRSGLPTRQNARRMTSRVRPKASTVARELSWKAAVISSLDRVGPPVTPACTFGKSRFRSAMTPRMISMARRSLTKLPLSPCGVSTRTKRRLLSSERKYPASGERSPREKSVPHGERYGVGRSSRPAIWSSTT